MCKNDLGDLRDGMQEIRVGVLVHKACSVEQEYILLLNEFYEERTSVCIKFRKIIIN